MLAAPLSLAQEAVYRCGQEYTNAPTDASRCERLAAQTVTVIPGTRVQGAVAPAVLATPAPAVSPPPPEASGAQRQRDDMARAIVQAELDKARQRHAALQQAYQQLPQAGDVQHKERLRAEVDRARRDIDSLQRELERRPLATAQP